MHHAGRQKPKVLIVRKNSIGIKLRNLVHHRAERTVLRAEPLRVCIAVLGKLLKE